MKKLNLNLEGLNGNAFYLIAYFRKEAKKAGWSQEEIEKVTKEATSDDYEHLLDTLMNV